MSSTIVLSQLRGLVERAEQVKGRLQKLYPGDDQWRTLTELATSLGNVATQLQQEMKTLKESRTARAWKESEKYRSHAQSVRGDLCSKGRLKNPAVFRRNIVVIFEGPKVSSFDSEDAKFRKESTRKRCDVLRSLSADGLVLWAIAYAPTLWAGGAMASDVFDCLTEDIEPEVFQKWPWSIRETLQKLKDDEHALRTSPDFDKFLEGWS